MQFRKKLLLTAVLGVALSSPQLWADGKDKEVTLIHMGDLHGHTIPRPNLRSDGDGRMEGGLARMKAEIDKIRKEHENTLLINTGDTTQGSGEALYSRGQALVDVVDMFKVDAFAPGNWEFVYGPDRFKEFFASGRWGALASNLYVTADKDELGNIVGTNIPATLPRVHTAAQYAEWQQWYSENGKRVLPPYSIKKVGDVKVGIVGCTTRRGPQVVGKWVTKGIEFTDCNVEVPKFVAKVREKGVDLVVLITEIEIGANIQMVRTSPELDGANHIDVILNSDMHEETIAPIEISNLSGTAKTLLIEEGQDGTMIGEITFKLSRNGISDWNFTAHRIHDRIKEDEDVAEKVKKVRAPYTTKFAEYAKDPAKRQAFHKNPFNETYLKGSLDEVVGTTQKALHRSGFTDEAIVNPGDQDAMPAVIEGTSHDWIADGIRWWAGSDLATVRGFRYGTHVKPGNITRNDLYHFVPIGARVGKSGKIHANQLRNQVDNSSLSVFSTNPMDTNVLNSPYNNEGWAGGWMFAYSGPTLKLDPYWVRRGPTAPPSPSDNTGAYPGDSRSRAITATMPCDRLPSVLAVKDDPNSPGTLVSEKTACEHSGNGNAVTMINQDNDSTAPRPGDWTPSWNATRPGYAVASTDVPGATTEFGGQHYRDLVIDEATGVWSSKKGPWNHNKFHHAPVLAVAGYYYSKSPYTLNNCPNCNPRGYSDIVPGMDLPADAAYLLPVNMNPDTGRAWLDANGRPALETDAEGHTLWVDGHPVVKGVEIDLTEILEKFLQSDPQDEVRSAEDIAYDAARGRGPANPSSHRITLLKALPGREFFGGMAVMQPLCGVVASYFSKPAADWSTGAGGNRIIEPAPECPSQ